MRASLRRRRGSRRRSRLALVVLFVGVVLVLCCCALSYGVPLGTAFVEADQRLLLQRDSAAAQAGGQTGVSKGGALFTAADDVALPHIERPGEPFVSTTEFVNCLAARLNIDLDSHTVGADAQTDDTIPLAVFPLMLELADHRALMCNLTVPIHLVLYVQNGDVHEVSRFLDEVERLFAWSGRVQVRRFPANIGFSGSVNCGIHEALRRRADEVPFLQVFNNDVRFPPRVLSTRLSSFRRLVSTDTPRLGELAEEVRLETMAEALGGNAPQVNARPPRAPWSPDATLVTSPLLPDRIRRLPVKLLACAFANHTGVLFFNRRWDGSTFCLSRLAMATVGYWDENFFPAYFEDCDYWWRARMLGFGLDTVPRLDATDGTLASREAVHFVNAVRKLHQAVSGGAAGSPLVSSPSLKRLTRTIQVLFRNPPSYLYANAKWGTYRGEAVAEYNESVSPEYRRFAEPFGPAVRVPVDVWVRDHARTAATREYLRLGCRARSSPSLLYNMKLVGPFAMEKGPSHLRTAVYVFAFLLLVACVCVQASARPKAACWRR